MFRWAWGEWRRGTAYTSGSDNRKKKSIINDVNNETYTTDCLGAAVGVYNSDTGSREPASEGS
jgi:hypothetical protein